MIKEEIKELIRLSREIDFQAFRKNNGFKYTVEDLLTHFEVRLKEKFFSYDVIRKAIEFEPYHTEYGNIIALKSEEELEKFIKTLKQ